MVRLSLLIVVLLISIACNQSTPATETTVMNASLIDQNQLTAAKTRWPESTSEQLTAGAIIFRTKCIKCHGNYQLTLYNEERWKHELHRMSTMVKLTSEEEEQLTRFVLSMRDTELKRNTNP